MHSSECCHNVFQSNQNLKKNQVGKKNIQRNQWLHKIVKYRHFYHTITLVYIYFSHSGQKYLENTWGGTNVSSGGGMTSWRCYWHVVTIERSVMNALNN